MSEGWKETLSDLGCKALQAVVVIVVEELIRKNIHTPPNYQNQDQSKRQKETASV